MGYVTKQKPAQAVLSAMRHVFSGKLHFSDEVTQRVLERVAAHEPSAEILRSNVSRTGSWKSSR